MLGSHSEDCGKDGAEPQGHNARQSDVIAQLLDAAMTADQDRTRELLQQYPHLREEFEGLCEDYSEVRTALRNHPECFGSEHDDVRRDLEDLIPAATAENDEHLISEVTRATRDWPEPKVVAFYQAFASSVVGVIAEEAGRELSQHDIRDEGKYLCTREILEKLRVGAQQGRHVRELLLEILAERWEDPKLPERLTRERLEELLIESGVIEHLRTWEAFLKAA